MKAEGHWVELRTLDVGDVVFVKHFAAPPEGPLGENGITATIYALTGGRTDEHVILKPDQGNLFEEHNSSHVYLQESNSSS